MEKNISKAIFRTVGDLKSLLNNIPDSVPVYVIGTSGGLYTQYDETGTCTAVSLDEESFIDSLETENA